jgi:hypothetical protein
VAYTLHDQGSYGLTAGGNPGALTVGVQFSVTSGSLTGIWWYSGPEAPALPSACAIYDVSTGDVVAGTLNSDPDWSGAAGSGWVKCAYDSVSLAADTNYVAAVYASALSNWYYDAGEYWTSGAGSGGLSSGPLSAPNSADAVNGQAPYISAGGITFPDTSVDGFDWGVDVEITTGTPVTGTFSLALAPLAAEGTGTVAVSGTFALALAPFAVAAEGGEPVTGTFSVALAPMAARFSAPTGRPPGGFYPDTPPAQTAGHWIPAAA